MRYLRFHDLSAKYGISYSRQHLARLEVAGKFPRHVQLSDNRIGWIEDEVIAWCSDRNASREAA